MSTPGEDDVVRRFRDEITELDRSILAAVNRRLELVAGLKRHKDEHGIAFVDPDRERQMLADRVRENGGPLSEEGLRAFYAELLALCKRELG
jgi:chorismate mutase/prephenate dehydratase